jgi:hypothetical protein
MAADDSRPGRASGYSIEDDADGGFNWSAFGSAGTRQGHAESRSDAEAAARVAEHELSRPERAGS